MTAPPATPPQVIAALQLALGAEHAAIFGYAALGPWLPTAQATRAHRDEAAHRAARDALIVTVAAGGQTPMPSAGSYAVPSKLDSAASARRYALSLETTCCQQWRYVVAVGAGAAPAVVVDAVRNLTASAVRATQWRTALTPSAPTTAFPGI